MFVNAPNIVPVPIPISEPVGPRCLAPMAPSAPVAVSVTPNVAADFPVSIKGLFFKYSVLPSTVQKIPLYPLCVRRGNSCSKILIF